MGVAAFIRSSVIVAVVSSTPAAAHASGPCAGAGWLAGVPVRAVYSTEVIAAALWDSDGAGPIGPRIVVGGTGGLVGPVQANGIAVGDPTTGTWSTLGAGFDRSVRALVGLSSGELVAGGSFKFSGSVRVDGLARWTGSAWAPLGPVVGTDALASVSAFAVAPNGDLVIGCFVPSNPIGGLSHNGVLAGAIGIWNGSTLRAMTDPSGSRFESVFSIQVLPNGDVVASGDFIEVLSLWSSVRRPGVIARWNGSVWTQLHPGRAGSVNLLPGGVVVAMLADVGPSALRIARLDGSDWTTLGVIDNPQSAGLRVLPDASVVAFGWFAGVDGVPAPNLARWNGASWSAMGGELNGRVNTVVALPDGSVAIGGVFDALVGGPTIGKVVRWDGSALQGTGASINDVRAFAEHPSGELFTSVFGLATIGAGDFFRGVGRWNGSVWTPVGPPMSATPDAVAVLSDGSVVVGMDSRATIGGATSGGVARFLGSSWSPLGTGVRGLVRALLPLPDGHLIAGGPLSEAGGSPAYGVARWDGAAWSPLGSGLTNAWSESGDVRALARLSDGSVVAGGSFSFAGGVASANIARWDGAEWSPLGLGTNGLVTALLALPGGDLLAGGAFSRAGGSPAFGVARWDGASWSPLGSGLSGTVFSLALQPDGGILAAGSFTASGTASTPYVARWDGNTWSPLGSTTTDTTPVAIASLRDGTVVVGGRFQSAGGQPSNAFARYSFTGIPTVSEHPPAVTVPAGSTLMLSAAVSIGFPGVSVQWQRDGAPIASGPGGASPGGGTVAGASGPLISPTTGASVVMTITDVRPSDEGVYTAVFANACGSVTTQPATVTVRPAVVGACCSGVICSVRVETSCIGRSTRLVGVGSVCNAPGNTTAPCCRADFTQDGTRNPADTLAFLNAYFSTDPAAVVLTDWDANGTRQPADLFAFLTAYFAGC